MNIKSVLTFGVGFAGGWAARSLADSPQGVGVKLMAIAMNAKERVGHWAAIERERLADMMAEARSKAEQDAAAPGEILNGVNHAPSSVTGQA